MPYSEKLADRIRVLLQDVPNVIEKKMFRGITFMVDDKMCISVGPDRIMCRIDPERHDALLEEMPCRTMVMKGREYKGYILVNEEDLARNRDLEFWVRCCLEFNGRAKRAARRADAIKGAKKKTAVPASSGGADAAASRVKRGVVKGKTAVKGAGDAAVVRGKGRAERKVAKGTGDTVRKKGVMTSPSKGVAKRDAKAGKVTKKGGKRA